MRPGRANDYLRYGTRRATAWARLRPNYLVIGAQKGGTTSLHDYLAEHPAVLTAVEKEVRYFHRWYPKGPYWYRSRFPLAVRATWARRRLGLAPAIGEASPDTIFDPRAPERVCAFEPRMRLIAILRDPVERAFSHWRMEVRRGTETLPFEDALDREEVELGVQLEQLMRTEEYLDAPFRTSYMARGRYADQLERWLALFPENQLLVLTSDELLLEPAAAMSRVWSFLGLPEWSGRGYELRGVQGEGVMAPATRERLARVFEPHNRRLERLLGRSFDWTRPSADGSRTEAVSRVRA